MKAENVKFLFHVIQTFFKKHPDIAWAVTLLFLPPLGIYEVYKHTHWSKWLKIGLSGYATAWTVGVLISSQQEIQSSKLKLEDSSLSNTPQNPPIPKQKSSIVTSISEATTARQIGDYFEYKYGVRRDTGTGM